MTGQEDFPGTKTARFDSEPALDASDRLGLLTVVAGLREVAAFGFAEHENEGK